MNKVYGTVNINIKRHLPVEPNNYTKCINALYIFENVQLIYASSVNDQLMKPVSIPTLSVSIYIYKLEDCKITSLVLPSPK